MISTELATISNEPTMSSIKLLEIINQYRLEDGKAVKRHFDFMKAIEDELDGDEREFSSVYLGGNGEKRPCYNLPIDECMQLAIRESKAVRKRVVC